MILEHLRKYKEALEKSSAMQEWYELQAPPRVETRINLLIRI
jgi:hypothetical protein